MSVLIDTYTESSEQVLRCPRTVCRAPFADDSLRGSSKWDDIVAHRTRLVAQQGRPPVAPRMCAVCFETEVAIWTVGTMCGHMAVCLDCSNRVEGR